MGISSAVATSRNATPSASISSIGSLTGVLALYVARHLQGLFFVVASVRRYTGTTYSV